MDLKQAFATSTSFVSFKSHDELSPGIVSLNMFNNAFEEVETVQPIKLEATTKISRLSSSGCH